MKLKFFISIIMTLSVSACQSFAEPEGLAALLSNSSEQVREEIRQNISLALNGTEVLIGENAFKDSDRLVIARKPRETLQHGVIMGRSEEGAYQFNLIKVKKKCYLVFNKNQQRFLLNHATCRISN